MSHRAFVSCVHCGRRKRVAPVAGGVQGIPPLALLEDGREWTAC
jgi:hypothetical protein